MRGLQSAESINVGYQALNRPENLPAERTILVMALPRGGSSFIASTLTRLGVPFDQPGPNYDDAEFFGAIYNKNWQLARRRIEEMNARHAIWGVKMMGPPTHLPEAVLLTRSPMVICVFRDPVAVALRKQMVDKEAHGRLQRGIAEAISSYRKLSAALMSLPEEIPILMVSYGNAMQNRAAFVRGVNDFIGQPFTSLPLDQADEIAAKVLNKADAIDGPRRARKCGPRV